MYFAENVTKNLLPDVSLAYIPTGILNAYEWIREMQARENAGFFTAHDLDGAGGKADEEGAGDVSSSPPSPSSCNVDGPGTGADCTRSGAAGVRHPA